MTTTTDDVERVWGDLREQYGYPRQGPPLTMAERIEGEMRNAERVADACIAEHGGRADCESWTDFWWSALVSDRDLPAFAYRTVLARCHTAEETRDLVAFAWTKPEWPDSNYGAEVWRTLFGITGYLHDDAHTEPRPLTVPTLYRGAIHSRRKGLAWTSDRDRALWFVNRFEPGGPYRRMHLWVLRDVPADRVLARFDCRGESEWVLDTRGLTPTKETP